MKRDRGPGLPDVARWVKPVCNGRVLFAICRQLGLTDRPYRKCARWLGDVLGNIPSPRRPGCYDALVRIGADFSSVTRLLVATATFGSVDDDPPAAMRYTGGSGWPRSPTRACLDEISSDTCRLRRFDAFPEEPTVLPALLPFLLLNGMHRNCRGAWPPAFRPNLARWWRPLIALIRNPELSDDQAARAGARNPISPPA